MIDEINKVRPEAQKIEYLSGKKLGEILSWSFALSRGKPVLQKHFFEYIALQEPTWRLPKFKEPPTVIEDVEAYEIVAKRIRGLVAEVGHIAITEVGIEEEFVKQYDQLMKTLADSELTTGVGFQNVCNAIFQEYANVDLSYMLKKPDYAGMYKMNKGLERKKIDIGFHNLNRSFLYEYTLGGKKLPRSVPEIYHQMFEDMNEYINSDEFQERHPKSTSMYRVYWERIIARYKKAQSK